MKFIHKITSAVLITLLTLLMPSALFAAPLTSLSNVLSTLKISELADHTIQFVTPTGVQFSDTIIITFDTFSVGDLLLSDIDLAEGNSSCGSFVDKTLANTAASSVWGVATTSSSITLTAPTDTGGEVTAGNCIQVEIGTVAGGTSVITNPGSADVYTVAYTGTFGDTGTTTVTILDDDQVQITAEVPQSITFSISETAASFGALSASASRWATTAGGNNATTSAHNLIAGTNATAGYSITVEGATLTSGANTITALGGGAGTQIGTEQFGMRITESGGSGTAVAPYDGDTYAYAADAGTTDQVASAAGSTSNTTYSVFYMANIASDTEAGTYSTALTYVATANF